MPLCWVADHLPILCLPCCAITHTTLRVTVLQPRIAVPQSIVSALVILALLAHVNRMRPQAGHGLRPAVCLHTRKCSRHTAGRFHTSMTSMLVWKRACVRVSVCVCMCVCVCVCACPTSRRSARRARSLAARAWVARAHTHTHTHTHVNRPNIPTCDPFHMMRPQ